MRHSFALAVDFTYRKASVTLPLFRGLDSSGESVYYILTDASDFAFAHALGINYAPKLRKAAGSPGAQTATIKDGLITFKGKVDFSPVYKVVPGSPDPFPSRRRPGCSGRRRMVINRCAAKRHRDQCPDR